MTVPISPRFLFREDSCSRGGRLAPPRLPASIRTDSPHVHVSRKRIAHQLDADHGGAPAAAGARITAMPHTDPRLARLQAILFDLDGTLIDTVELILSSFRYATEAVLGKPLPDELLMRNVGVPLAIQMAEFAPAHVQELLRVYREHNAEHHDQLAKRYPGTDETLAKLHERGARMAVVTSKSRSVAERGLRLFGYERYFQHMVGADDVEIHKPDPYPLRFAADLMNVPVQACMYVGDSPHDMAAAKAADSIAVAAMWGPFSDRVLEPGPDYALGNIRELLDLLDGSGERFRVVSPGA